MESVDLIVVGAGKSSFVSLHLSLSDRANNNRLERSRSHQDLLRGQSIQQCPSVGGRIIRWGCLG